MPDIDTGALVRVTEPSARENGQARVLLTGGTVWTTPVLEGGASYHRRWLCADDAAMLDHVLGESLVTMTPAAARLVRRLRLLGLVDVAHEDDSSVSPTDVDVVVPCHDPPASLASLLASLGRLGFASITVVDDASTPPLLWEHVADGSSEVAIRRSSERLGPGEARNLGAMVGSARWLLFIDADVELPDPEAWWNALASGLADPDVAGAAPRIMTTTSRKGSVADVESSSGTYDRGPVSSVVRPHGVVPFVPGASLVLRRECFELLGGFDVSLGGGEDVDLVWRVVDRCGLVLYRADAVVHHPAPASIREWLGRRWRYGRSQAALGLRHHRHISSLDISPWSLAMFTLFFGGGRRRPFAATLIGIVSVAALARDLRPWSDRPAVDALRLVSTGTVAAGSATAACVRRVWAPGLVAVAVVCRPPRRWLTIAFVAPSLGAPWPAVALERCGDLAGALGVWRGVIEQRTLRPLLPKWVAVDDLLVDERAAATRR